MSIKLVDFESLKYYDEKINKKIKENYVTKSQHGDVSIDGNIAIKGNLQVQGSTQTVNQETLTIKDNFIGVNGNGTTLDATGMAGIVAITGEENYILKADQYKIDPEKLLQALEISTVDYPDCPGGWEFDYGPYHFIGNQDKVNRFNNLNLLGMLYFYFNFEEFDPAIWLEDNTSHSPFVWVIENRTDTPVNKKYRCEIQNQDGYYFPYQIIPENDIDFVCSFLVHENGTSVTREDFELTGQAYAAPIYDKNEDSLKIGLGSYEKDENGNIKSFTFGAGQGQSIATRADDIKDGNLIKWNAVSNKLVDTGTSIKELEEKLQYTVSINIENATGTDSLVQKWTPGEGEPDATHFANTCEGASSVVFGEANSNTSKRTLISGKMNRSNAGNSIIGGLGNGRGIVGTPDLKELEGANLLIAGLKNQNIGSSSQNVILSGQENINDSSADTIINGFKNHNINSGRSLLIGAENINDSSANSIIAGAKNENLNSSKTFITGQEIVNKNSTGAIIGGYRNNNTDSTDVIINGTDNTNSNSPDALIVGHSNTNTHGAYTILGGNSNNNYGTGALVTGENNINNGQDASVSGASNDNKAARSIVGGLSNNNTGFESIVAGKTNTNQGAASLIIGESNQNIRVSDTNIGSNDLIVGEANINNGGKNNIVGGDNNRNSGSNSIVEGQNNSNNGSNNAIFGDGNNITNSYDVLVSGKSNNNEKANYSALFGTNITNSANYSIVSGEHNKNSGAHSIVVGYANQNVHPNSDGNLTVGKWLYNATKNGAVFGRYNDAKSNNLLEIGNGTDNSNKSNAFEVTDTGIVRAFGAPVAENDVVRLKELNSVADKLVYATNEEIDALWA